MATYSAGIPRPPYQVSQKQAHVATDTARAHQEPGVIRPNNLPQSYPYAPFPHDPRDEDERIKSGMLGLRAEESPGGGVANLAGVLPMYQMSQNDIEYVKDKQAYLENAQFELWAYNQFDHTDPANQRIFAELFPEFVQRQRDYIDYCAEIMKRWAYIRNTNIQTKEDVMFKYLLQTGQIHVPKDLSPEGMLVNHPEATGGMNQPLANEERGIFNPLRLLGIDRPVPAGGYDPLNRANAFPTEARAMNGLSMLNPGPSGQIGGGRNDYQQRLQSLMFQNQPARGSSIGWPWTTPPATASAAGPMQASSWLGMLGGRPLPLQ